MSSNQFPWCLEIGEGPLLATAIHAGHDLRAELHEHVALSEAERLREEDPFTDGWTTVAPTRLVVAPSRFEVDMNRSRDKAVYRTPEDAWGLQVWKGILPDECVQNSLAIYDAFYKEVHTLLTRKVEQHGRVVILDLHSYNHRRGGPDAAAADTEGNPEVNVGTGTMVRSRWATVVNRFIGDLQNHNYLGRHLDVRENIKFRGGYFPTWVHENFPESVCVFSVEFKKFFMDEWTGEAESVQLYAIQHVLCSTVWGIYEELARLKRD